MISRRSRRTKSTTYGPIGSWRTNLQPSIARDLSLFQRRSSAFVEFSRRRRARVVLIALAPRMRRLPLTRLASLGDLSPQAGHVEGDRVADEERDQEPDQDRQAEDQPERREPDRVLPPR